MIKFFGIPQFNALFIPYLSNANVGVFELILSVILFCTVLILRTSVIEYTNLSPLPKWNRRLAQLGLYLHGVLSTIVFFDGYKAVFDSSYAPDPRVFLTLFIFGSIVIKCPALYRAYHSLITNKKFILDLKRGLFI
jgi:hypothetical protein